MKKRHFDSIEYFQRVETKVRTS